MSNPDDVSETDQTREKIALPSGLYAVGDKYGQWRIFADESRYFFTEEEVRALAATELPARGVEDGAPWEERFWSIVDGRGLIGLPSDEWNALTRLVSMAWELVALKASTAEALAQPQEPADPWRPIEEISVVKGDNDACDH